MILCDNQDCPLMLFCMSNVENAIIRSSDTIRTIKPKKIGKEVICNNYIPK